MDNAKTVDTHAPKDDRPKNKATGQPMSGVDIAAKAAHEKWVAEKKKGGAEHVYSSRNGEDLMQEYEYLSDSAQAEVRVRAQQDAGKPAPAPAPLKTK